MGLLKRSVDPASEAGEQQRVSGECLWIVRLGRIARRGDCRTWGRSGAAR
jgi:hypothetical protein